MLVFYSKKSISCLKLKTFHLKSATHVKKKNITVSKLTRVVLPIYINNHII